jgi:diadenosine tetraphosphate (Ap4A) HIT family hydrolase
MIRRNRDKKRVVASPSHTLVVTRRQVPDFFGCTPQERADLNRELRPDAFNVGFNSGVSPGAPLAHVK